ncbi:MAG: HAMP domain-containing sensor histidine kinase [Candidatus Doudnabacteria bacterium]|nr:HAMP domain-containing sensor histidine kinase [Candidatus Doudnabacteria bacterium]
MLAVILCVFSFSLYYSLAKNLREDFESETAVQQVRHELVESALDHIQTTIVFVDIGVLLLFSSLAYVLAGKTLKPIELALDAQKQFSADASHEFRTPLSIIKNELEVALQSDHIDAKALIRSNLEEVNHMSSMVDQLLKLSRSENHKNGFKMAPVKLTEIVKSSVTTMQKLAQIKDIKLSLETVEQGDISGSFGALQEVVLNLLQNAIDYTPEGGSVKVAVKATGKFQELTIQDTGIGIEAKDLPHIFERFYKADNARSLRSNSSGLGLSIVYDIVQRHGAKVFVSSTPDKGTLVTLIFPLL